MSDPGARSLFERDLDPNPLAQFRLWYDQASAVVPLPEAVAVATATVDGRPSVRMVLLKAFDERGFTFHSGYESRKGRELAENPRGALLFYWHELGQQVRVEGRVERVSRAESEQYFRTRPLRSRVAALASRQSEVIASREELEARFEDLLARHGADLPLPDSWGGFRLVPESFEFWQHREDRLHDRVRYRLADGGWMIERLSP